MGHKSWFYIDNVDAHAIANGIATLYVTQRGGTKKLPVRV
jgi:hypothetical protein